MDRATLEARRDELRAQLKQAEASTLRLQGALAILDELLADAEEAKHGTK